VILVVVVVVVLLSASQEQPTPCSDRAACVTAAESALAAKDYERFHDLAWAAYRKGKGNDPELMLLVARAQSLSGRPLDALVMLERIAALGAATDAATSEDFARVRALPRWSELSARLKAPSTSADAPSPKEKAPPSKEKAPSPNEKAPSPNEKAPSPKKEAPSPKEKAPSSKEEAPSSSARAPSTKARFSFTTILTPTALAHDAVSQRFLIADRKARRIAVVDGNSGNVATLVGAQGALGEIGGMAIDPQEGDLWVVSTGDDGPMLHKLQLISGRMLASVPLRLEDPIAAMAHVRRVGLVVADRKGVIWRVRSDGRTDKLGALEYVPLALAADARGRLYVAAGTSRLARFAVDTALRRIDTIEIDPSIPVDAPFVVVDGALRFVVPGDGDFQLRSVNVK
jgi:hypothetical protein